MWCLSVIDGGIRIEPAPQGGLRNAYWRSHTAGPGRTCIRCLGQYDVADVQLERDGSLDDASYVANLPTDSPLRARRNVYATSLSAASALTNQFLSLVVAPSGFGDPGPLKFDLRRHRAERVQRACVDACSYSSGAGTGDRRRDPTGEHGLARDVIANDERLMVVIAFVGRAHSHRPAGESRTSRCTSRVDLTDLHLNSINGQLTIKQLASQQGVAQRGRYDGIGRCGSGGLLRVWPTCRSSM